MPTPPSRRTQLVAAVLACWLLAPTAVAAWFGLQDGIGAKRAVAMGVFATCLYIAPLVLVGRVRRLFLLWLPFGFLAPVQCYLVCFFRGAPNEALMQSVLHVSFGEALEMLGGFGWLPWLLPVTWVGYVALLGQLEPEAGLSVQGRKALAAGLLLCVWGGVARDSRLGDADVLPPVLDGPIISATYPAGVAVSLAKSLPSPPRRFVQVQASAPPAPQLVILVIGESLRADHLGINGYARDTTPGLSRLGSSLLSFRNASTTANYTVSAVPRIVSRPVDGGLLSLVSVFKEAGFRTAWLSNQERLVFQADADVNEFAETDWRRGVRYDTELLPRLASTMRQLGDRQLIVLHILGSHFPYEARYDPRERVFTPVFGVKRFGDTGLSVVSPRFKQELINSYDNTVLATDRFLTSVIAQADAAGKPAVVMFTADHGENLYDDERQLVLHSGVKASRADTFVPLLVWANQAYQRQRGEKLALLEARRDAPVSHLNVMPTLLDLAEVRYASEPRELSIASPDFRPQPRFTGPNGSLLTTDVESLR